jgi:hypothetical protein
MALLLLTYEEPAAILLWFCTISYDLAAGSLLGAKRRSCCFWLICCVIYSLSASTLLRAMRLCCFWFFIACVTTLLLLPYEVSCSPAGVTALLFTLNKSHAAELLLVSLLQVLQALLL